MRSFCSHAGHRAATSVMFSQAGDDGVSGRGGGTRRGALDTRNVVVNLRALVVTSVGVDACKLALAIVTMVRLQPNQGFVFLASIAVWSLSAKVAVISASLATYGLVLWAANREARRPMAVAAAVFVVAIALRFLFMVEGAVVVLQESFARANATAATAAPDDAQHLFIPAAPKGVLAKARGTCGAAARKPKTLVRLTPQTLYIHRDACDADPLKAAFVPRWQRGQTTDSFGTPE